MSKSKHTPAPWTLEIDSQFSIYGPDRYSVTAVCKDDDQYGSPEQDEANAYLITAAPEMLNLLKDCHDVLLSRSLAGGITDQTIMSIRRLVSKAEGQDGA